MADLLLFTASEAAVCLPSLALLGHRVRTVGLAPSALASTASVPADGYLVDGTSDLVAARALCRLMASLDDPTPTLVIVAEGGLTALAPDWGVRDIVLPGATPAEVEARLRLLLAASRRDGEGDAAAAGQGGGTAIAIGELAIDEQAYTARCRGDVLDLTYKEFELLRFLAANPDRVFTREQLLDEVWGADYYGGARTVDVHIRRLRAKLGEADTMIQTVRNVGYRLGSRGAEEERA